MIQFAKGMLVGALIMLLIAIPSFILGQQQNMTTGRVYGTSPGTNWLPTGMGFVVFTGACPSGSTQVTALDGKMPMGTLAAHMDIGGTGGADSVTPTVATLTAAAQTFTGSSATSSAVSAGTPAGTNGTVTGPAQVITWPVGVPMFSGSALATHAHELPWQIPSTTTIRQIAIATFGTGTSRAATAVSAAGTANTTSAAVALSQAVSAGTPAGTVAWPAGVPTNATSTIPAETFVGSALGTHSHTLTATGTNGTSAVTGTLNSFDNRSAYVKVIYCVKS